MSASLVRAACAATSAKSPATSARFCHRTSASGAPFSPLRTACAVSVRPTPASVIPEPGYPFRPSSRTFRSEPHGRGVERRSSTSAITVPIREHNLRIVRLPADSISSIDRRFSAGRPSSSSCWGRSPSPISPCCHRAAATESGAGRRFRVRQQSPRAFSAFAPGSLELHCYPDCDVEHTPLVAEHVVRAEAGASCPDRRDEVVVIACPERDPLCRREDRLRPSLPRAS